MNEISKTIGERIRNCRNRKGLSQEALAERCGLHVTYIGQLERGEKNATLESIEKVIKGLNISFETLFEKLHPGEGTPSLAAQCYHLVDGLSDKEQAAILDLMKNVIQYKKL